MSLKRSLLVSSTSLMSSKKHQKTLSGLATARGLAEGPVFLYRSTGDLLIPEFVVELEDVPKEVARLRRAIVEVKRDLEGLISVLKQRTGREDVRIFECHLQLVEDEFLQEETIKAISNQKLNAEAAVRRTVSQIRAHFDRMNDSYFRERVLDLEDVERRLQKALAGFTNRAPIELKTPAIIVANDLTPSETVQLPRELVLGFATNTGSTTSHVALLARSLGIPAVCGLKDITAQVQPGQIVLLDGTAGSVTINPTDETRAAFRALQAEHEDLLRLASAKDSVGCLKSGEKIQLYANIQKGVALKDLQGSGAKGVGLYRSEYLWLDREREPTEEEQFEAYKEVAELGKALDPSGSVTIRVLDIGGDKLVKGISSTETNPFLGNRSIRYLLTNRNVFRTQLRAILRASDYGRVKIMYPMVSCLEEAREAACVLTEVKRHLLEEGIPFDNQIEVGAMIEVPSAALLAEALAKEFDFFSVGTNALVQYAMAADRGNEAVAYLYQPLNPAIIKLMQMTLAGAQKEGIPVSVCGESAADPVAGILWVALGVTMLSMSGAYIPVIAKILSQLTKADLDDYAQVPARLPLASTAQDVYLACHEWMVAHVREFEGVYL